ncbi:hypothetical protein D3C77_628820 [compost metagenome]
MRLGEAVQPVQRIGIRRRNIEHGIRMMQQKSKVGIAQRIFIQLEDTATLADSPAVQIDHRDIENAFIFVGLPI